MQGISFAESFSDPQVTGLTHQSDIESGDDDDNDNFESEPLNTKKDSLDGNSKVGNTSVLGNVAETTLMESVSGGVAGVTVACSGIAVIFGGWFLLPVGLATGVIAPYAWYQQRKVTDINNLKETYEALYREVETLQAENERLRRNVEELSDTVKRLGDIQDALDVITQTQGHSVSAFAEQVEENRAILEQYKANLKANVLQNLFSVVMSSDKDGDLMIDDNEIEDVLARMSTIQGVTVNQVLFRQKIIESGRSFDAIMTIVRGLILDGGADQNVFVLD